MVAALGGLDARMQVGGRIGFRSGLSVCLWEGCGDKEVEADASGKQTQTKPSYNGVFLLSFLLQEAGDNLSVGQRQLFCLARALLQVVPVHRPPLLDAAASRRRMSPHLASACCALATPTVARPPSPARPLSGPCLAASPTPSHCRSAVENVLICTALYRRTPPCWRWTRPPPTWTRTLTP